MTPRGVMADHYVLAEHKRLVARASAQISQRVARASAQISQRVARASAQANKSGDKPGKSAQLRAGAIKSGRLGPMQRVPCGGKRRRDGKPCEALSVPGKRRCKWHGGFSTGPKTAEGKAKALANLRQNQRGA